MRIATPGHRKTSQSATLADDEASIGRESRPAFADAAFCRALRSRKQFGKTLFKGIENLPVRIDAGRFFHQTISAGVGVKRLGFPSAEQQSTVAYSSVQR